MQSKGLKWFLGGFSLTLIAILIGLAIFNIPTVLAVEGGPVSPNKNIETIANPDTQGDTAEINRDGSTIDVVIPAGTPLIVPAADFHSDGFYPDSAWFDFFNGTWEGRSWGDGCMVAPVYLPDGVTVTGVLVTFIDNDVGNHINFDLFRTNLSTSVVENLAYLNTTSFSESPNPQQHSTTFITYGTIDHSNYTYFLTTCLPTENTKLVGLQVYYTP